MCNLWVFITVGGGGDSWRWSDVGADAGLGNSKRFFFYKKRTRGARITFWG